MPLSPSVVLLQMRFTVESPMPVSAPTRAKIEVSPPTPSVRPSAP